MSDLKTLLENNKRWADSIKAEQADFFTESNKGQSPKYLWIGCADSRVPACQVLGLEPGDVFVHRNIANLVCHSDLNMLSVLQYAVDVLKVEHVLVCGHYGCGGVKAAMGNANNGIVDNWIRPIKDIYWVERKQLRAIESEDERVNRLSEFNVRYQVHNVATTNIVQNAWRRGQNLTVHGLVYDLASGELNNLDVSIDQIDNTASMYHYD
ncbi:MAG: carbonate dehydratase [Pseudomonadota bacterium]